MMRYISRSTSALKCAILPCRHISCSSHPKVTETRIPVPWGHIAGKWWNGQNTQPILAVHGWLDNAATFDRLIPLLPTNQSVLAIDLPGHGKSSHLPNGFFYHILDNTIAIKRVVDFYKWENFSLMGHSLGGQACFLYAVTYNQTVNNLILLDILTPLPFAKHLFTEGGKALDQFIIRDNLVQDTAPWYSLDELSDLVVKSQDGGLSKEGAKILLQRGTMENSDDTCQLSRDLRLKSLTSTGWSAREVLDFCNHVKARTLCIKADSSAFYGKQDFFYQCWASVEKSAQQAILKVVQGKHHVHLENPQLIASIVQDFLKTS